jgi:hypothetical protein
MLREQLHWYRAVHWPSEAARSCWTRLSPLGRDITLILLIKAALLFLLWGAFFRVPAAPHPDANAQLAVQRLLGPNPAPEINHADR